MRRSGGEKKEGQEQAGEESGHEGKLGPAASCRCSF
jgi:hypothetical protein